MANKRHKPEEIVRQVEVLVGQGMARTARVSGPRARLNKPQRVSTSSPCFQLTGVAYLVLGGGLAPVRAPA